MMMKFVFSALFLTSPFLAIAQDGSEDALIINQELEYLQSSAAKIADLVKVEEKYPVARELPSSADSLESRYFGDNESDSLETKSAAPVRVKKTRSY